MLRRRSSRKRGIAIATSALAGTTTVACSLFVSTDGLTSNEDAGSDAAIDTSSSDAISIVDAHDEAAIDANAPAFCVTNASALFCDDFDDGPIGATWDSTATTQGTLALDGTSFLSAPFSAAFTANGNGSNVILAKSVGASVARYRAAFAVRVVTPPSASGDYQILATVGNGNGAQLELYEDSGSFSVNDRINGTYGTYYAAVPGISIDAWHDFVLHLQFAASGGTTTASIDLDGTNVVPSFNLSSAFNQPNALGLTVGIPYGAGSSTATSFDNVAISSE